MTVSLGYRAGELKLNMHVASWGVRISHVLEIDCHEIMDVHVEYGWKTCRTARHGDNRGYKLRWAVGHTQQLH
jgi:hypothetical protein